MRPVVVNEDNESIVRQKLCGEESEKPVRFKFNIGDQVRISKGRRTFKKGYLPIHSRNLNILKRFFPLFSTL